MKVLIEVSEKKLQEIALAGVREGKSRAAKLAEIVEKFNGKEQKK